MEITIKIPLEDKNARFNDVNEKNWEQLSRKEKLFYKYIIENDTSLSSVLVGVFSAYVVNIFSNLISMHFDDGFLMVFYFLNAVFAVWTLYLVIQLYLFHVRKERRDEEDATSVYVNKSFERLYKNYKEPINIILKKITVSIFLLLISLIFCCGFNNIIR